jgi:ABC-2 type transport system permease protein
MVASNVALYPSIRDVPAFSNAFKQLSPGLRNLFGGSAALQLTSPAGYLNARQFSLLFPALLLIFAIALGAHIVAGTEEDGTLEYVVALPVSRRRVALERFAAMIALVVALSLVSALVLLALAPTVGLLKGLSVGSLLVATGAVTGYAVFHGSIAFALGCLAGRRSLALGANAAIIVTGYTLHGVAAVSHTLHGLRLASPWYWYVGQNALIEGANPASTILPLVGVGLLVALAVRHFEGRDLR